MSFGTTTAPAIRRPERDPYNRLDREYVDDRAFDLRVPRPRALFLSMNSLANPARRGESLLKGISPFTHARTIFFDFSDSREYSLPPAIWDATRNDDLNRSCAKVVTSQACTIAGVALRLCFSGSEVPTATQLVSCEKGSMYRGYWHRSNKRHKLLRCVDRICELDERIDVHRLNVVTSRPRSTR